MASVALFKAPCPTIMLKSTLDTQWDFQMEGEGGFHHISPYQFKELLTHFLTQLCSPLSFRWFTTPFNDRCFC